MVNNGRKNCYRNGLIMCIVVHETRCQNLIWIVDKWSFIVKMIVMLKVISLALLLMIGIRFAADKSIAYILRSRYGNTLVKKVRKFEKIDYKLRKCNLDIVFLETCLENNIISKFLNFRVSNLHLKTSRAYYSCQLKLLKEDMSVKKSKVKTFEKDFIVLIRKLRETLGIMDCTHLCCLFLSKYDRKLNVNKISTLKSFLILVLKILKHHMTLI